MITLITTLLSAQPRCRQRHLLCSRCFGFLKLLGRYQCLEFCCSDIRDSLIIVALVQFISVPGHISRRSSGFWSLLLVPASSLEVEGTCSDKWKQAGGAGSA